MHEKPALGEASVSAVGGVARAKMERRRHRRFPCDGAAEVVVFRPESLIRGRVRDISRSGCFIETRAPLKMARMTEVELRFMANGNRMVALAHLMDVQPGRGAGFQFLTADPRLDAGFERWIEDLNAASPA
ncbi:MAG TPA: PilZ domain-containing protein [Terracidiphilus sp.]|nr:PilZ domain-containing protein [Terracidiphilus sp.]